MHAAAVELLAETDLTAVGLLLAGLTTLAGVVARLYVIQERNAKRAADAYARLAVYLLESSAQRCEHGEACPLRRSVPLPDDVRRLVTGAAQQTPTETNPSEGDPRL